MDQGSGQAAEEKAEVGPGAGNESVVTSMHTCLTGDPAGAHPGRMVSALIAGSSGLDHLNKVSVPGVIPYLARRPMDTDLAFDLTVLYRAYCIISIKCIGFPLSTNT